MPKPLETEKRAAILADIRAGELSRAAIGRKHDVSGWTVGKIAKDAGIEDAFSREQTKNATQAAVLDAKARRAALQHKFLDRAEEALDQMDQPHVVFSFGGKDNTYNQHTLERPPTADQRNLMIIAATGLDKSIAIDKHDADDGAGDAKNMLTDLMGALGQAWRDGEAGQA